MFSDSNKHMSQKRVSKPFAKLLAILLHSKHAATARNQTALLNALRELRQQCSWPWQCRLDFVSHVSPPQTHNFSKPCNNRRTQPPREIRQHCSSSALNSTHRTQGARDRDQQRSVLSTKHARPLPRAWPESSRQSSADEC